MYCTTIVAEAHIILYCFSESKGKTKNGSLDFCDGGGCRGGVDGRGGYATNVNGTRVFDCCGAVF